MGKNVLIVDDEQAICLNLSKFISKIGYNVSIASNVKDAKEILNSYTIDIIVSDIVMPGDDGIELLKYTKEKFPKVKVILITGFTTIELTLKAIKGKVDAFLEKPISFNELESELKRLENYDNIPLSSNNSKIQEESKIQYIQKSEMVMSAKSPMVDILKFIEVIANKKVSVFIYGESGTGKELVAKAIYKLSKKNSNAFVPINCGAIPKELIESELFGHSKGSFTGAITDKVGRVEMAHKGVLFLDEIGELSLDMQVKFLRVLQEKKITPVGGRYSKDIDFRLVSATNVNLEKAIEDKKFREDLFYRVNVIPISLPALRNRKEDIPALISYFIEQNNEEYETSIQGVTHEALDYFINYPWPGNIRELQNMIERISIIKDEGYIEVKDLSEKMVKNVKKKSDQNYGSLFYNNESESFDFKEMIESYQKEIIQYSLKKFDWNKKKASEFLKLKRTTFVEMVKRLDITNDKIK